MLDFSAQKLQLNAFSVLASNLIDGAKIGPFEHQFCRWICWRMAIPARATLDEPAGFQPAVACPRPFEILGQSA